MTEGTKGRRVVAAVLAAAMAAGCASGPSDAETAPTTVPTTASTAASSTIAATTAPTATSPPSTAETTTTTAPPPEPVTIAIAGDTSFTDGLDGADPLGQVAEVLTGYDYALVNLETAVADPGVGSPPVAKRFLFRSAPESLDLLVDAGVDGVTLGNNHVLDYGVDAVAQTLDELDARSLDRVGAGDDETEAYRPLVAEVGEWRVAIHSFSRVPCDWSAQGENLRPQVAWACPPFLERADREIEAAMADTDITIVNVHGGAEGELCPSDFMLDLYAHWADLGVDAIVSGHPHVVQGVAVIGDTPVALSTGNFAFPPARGITANSIIVELEIAPNGDDGASVGLSILPVRADGGVVRPANDAEHADILDQINRHSDGARVDADGRLVVDPAHDGAC